MKHAKQFFVVLSVVLAVGVGGCATTMGPAGSQLVSVGPVSGACPQCGQGITVPANGAALCPYCGGTVRLAQPAPATRSLPSVVLPQVVTVVTGGRGGHHRPGGYGHYGWRPPRPVGVPVPIYRSGGYYGGTHGHYGWRPPRPVGVPVPIYR